MTELADQVLHIVMWSCIAVGAVYLSFLLIVLAAMWWMDR